MWDPDGRISGVRDDPICFCSEWDAWHRRSRLSRRVHMTIPRTASRVGAAILLCLPQMLAGQAAPLRRPIPYPVVPSLEFQLAVENGTRTETGEPGPAYWQQWTDYELSATLDPDEKRVTGSARITHFNRFSRPLPVVALHLHQNVHAEGALRNTPVEVTGGMTLNLVVADGITLEEGSTQAGPAYEVDGTLLVIRPPRSVPAGGSMVFEFEWSFIVPQDGLGRMGWDDDNVLFVGYWFPKMAVLDDVIGWHVDPYLGNAEFYDGFGSYDFSIDAPAGWIVMASGELLNREEVLLPHIQERLAAAEASDAVIQVVGQDDLSSGQVTQPGVDGRVTWRFQADTVRDVAFSATRDSRWDAVRTPVGDRDGDGRPEYARVDAFYRSDAERWTEMARYAQHSIDFLSRYTGLSYPWPHMSAVEGVIRGGMEFPMMTLIEDYNRASDAALYNVAAHELAHMWVPMIVGVDERRHAWMDEGTSNFNENQARAEFFPGENHESADQGQYVQITQLGIEGELMRRTDYHYDDFARGVASCSKPATILVALRALLGEETFMRGYRKYLADWAYKHPKPMDFFNAMATAAGQDLGWFWRTWYYETWTLDQAIADVSTFDEETRIVIDDLGLAPMPVRLTVTLENGEERQESIGVDVWLDGERTTAITVRFPSPVVRVEIDPDGNFPDTDRTNNVWTRD